MGVRSIVEWLISKGFEPKLIGTTYLADAIHIVVTNDKAKRLTMNEIYGLISERHCGAPSRDTIQSNMAHAIAKVYDNGKKPSKAKYSNVGMVQSLANEYKQWNGSEQF